MLKNFNPFDIFIGIVAMLCGLAAFAIVAVLFNDGILHWFILCLIACYYLGKFIRERTGL
jgi:hypothetical protein